MSKNRESGFVSIKGELDRQAKEGWRIAFSEAPETVRQAFAELLEKRRAGDEATSIVVAKDVLKREDSGNAYSKPRISYTLGCETKGKQSLKYDLVVLEEAGKIINRYFLTSH